jgi:hypothetical protein
MTEDQVQALTDKINALRKEAQDGEKNGTLTTKRSRELNDAIVKLQAERSAGIAHGCPPCPSCGTPPVGMVQNMALNNQPVEGFEIGCPHCVDHRAASIDLGSTRKAWERGPVARGWRPPPSGRKLEKGEKGFVSVLPNGQKIDWSAKMTPQERNKARRRAMAATPLEATKAPKTGKAETLAES